MASGAVHGDVGAGVGPGLKGDTEAAFEFTFFDLPDVAFGDGGDGVVDVPGLEEVVEEVQGEVAGDEFVFVSVDDAEEAAVAGLAGFVDATASGDLFASSFEDGFHSVGVGEPVEVAGAAGYPVEQDEESVAALPAAVREFGGQHVEVVGVAAEVVSESEEQGAFERGEPFFDFEHRDREQHPDGVGGEFVVKGKFLPVGSFAAGSDLAPALVVVGLVGVVVVTSFSGVAFGTAFAAHRELRGVDVATGDRSAFSGSVAAPEVDASDVGVAAEFGTECPLVELPCTGDVGGVNVDGGDDAVALSAAFVGFVVDPGGFFR